MQDLLSDLKIINAQGDAIGDELLEFFLAADDLPAFERRLKAWKALSPTGLATDVNIWLPRVSQWIDEGLEFVESGTKVVIKNGADEVGEIVNSLLKVKYTHFGGEVVCHSRKTTTIVGRFVDNIDGGGITVIKDSKLWKYGENPSGVNILNDPNWTWQINSQWLTNAANRGDVIRVVSDPTNVNHIWVDGIVNGIRTTFGREVELLEDVLGYTYNPSTFEFIK